MDGGERFPGAKSSPGSKEITMSSSPLRLHPPLGRCVWQSQLSADSSETLLFRNHIWSFPTSLPSSFSPPSPQFLWGDLGDCTCQISLMSLDFFRKPSAAGPGLGLLTKGRGAVRTITCSGLKEPQSLLQPKGGMGPWLPLSHPRHRSLGRNSLC